MRPDDARPCTLGQAVAEAGGRPAIETPPEALANAEHIRWADEVGGMSEAPYRAG